MSVSDPLCIDSLGNSQNSPRRRFYHRLVGLDGTPDQIALGFALGLMIGMTPFWGTHIFLSLGLTSLLGWNRIAAVIGVNITNVFTAPLIYPVNYWVGLRVSGWSAGARWPGRLDWEGMVGLIRKSPMVVVDLSVGGLILGLPLAVAGYLIVFRMVRYYRERRAASASDPCAR